jgi:hypothetical protein
VKLPQRRIGIPEGVFAMSAEIVRGFSQFLLCGLQGSDCGANMWMAGLTDDERESAHNDHAGQKAH